MKIERVDDTTIKCYLSEEELKEYQVDYKDFLTRTEKAQQLMKHIIDEARETVGYNPPQLAFEMQITMVPEQGMVLTFSEKEPFDIGDPAKVEGFLNNLKTLFDKLSAAKGAGGGKLPEFDGNLDAFAHRLQAAAGKGNPQAKAGKEDKDLYEAVFAFKSMNRVMSYASLLPSTLRVDSKLYKMDDYYFLYIGKGKASYERYSKACVQALEYASLFRAGDGCTQILEERGELIIQDKALKMINK